MYSLAGFEPGKARQILWGGNQGDQMSGRVSEKFAQNIAQWELHKTFVHKTVSFSENYKKQFFLTYLKLPQRRGAELAGTCWEPTFACVQEGLDVRWQFSAYSASFRPGTDVMILKIFSPKNLEKNCCFWLKTKPTFEKDHNIGI
jgi:hypothetical protein